MAGGSAKLGNANFSLPPRGAYAVLLCALLVLAPLRHPCCQAAAGADPVIQMDGLAADDLGDALGKLAASWGIGFLIEGSSPHAKRRDAANYPSAPVTLEEAVANIASRFDYLSTRCGDIFVLTSRFDDPTEAPEITSGEWAQAIENIETITAPYNPHATLLPSSLFHRNGQEFIVEDIAHSLTPPQWESLSRGSLRVMDLTDGQKALVRQLLLYFYIQSMFADEVSKAKDLMLCAPGATLGLGQVGRYGEVFGCEISRPGRPPNYFYPLGGAFGQQYTFDGYTEPAKPPAHGPSEGTDADDAAQGAPSAALTNLKSLAESIDRAKPSDGSLAVDPAIADKRFLWIGPPPKSADAFAMAALQAFNLKLVTRGDGPARTLLLTCPAAEATSKDISKLPAQLRAVLPGPLLRVLHIEQSLAWDQGRRQAMEARQGLDPTIVHAPTNQNTSPGLESMAQMEAAIKQRKAVLAPYQPDEDYRAFQRHYFELPGDLRAAAVRTLEACAAPRLKDHDFIPLDGLGPQADAAFALFLNSNWLEGLARVAGHETPPYMLDPGRVVLSGGLKGEGRETRLSLFLTSGDDQAGMGTAGLPYPR